jgi:DNA-binding NtrC family response regulator
MDNQSQFKFFIVDDHIFSAKMHVQFLKNLGLDDITYYSNGSDCLKNLQQNPDIIFLDHHMEDISGLEVLKEIKKINPNIYVVMVSGETNVKIAMDALQFGAFDYILKDDLVADKMKKTLNKIIIVKEQLKKSPSSLIKKLLYFF